VEYHDIGTSQGNEVFLSHTVYHHEASERAFGISDEGVCPVESSAKVLHFQKCADVVYHESREDLYMSIGVMKD